MASTPNTRQLPEAGSSSDAISLDAAYAIVSEMRGVYKNALEASSATNRGLQMAVQVALFRFCMCCFWFCSGLRFSSLQLVFFTQLLTRLHCPRLQNLETSNQRLRAALAQCATLCTQGRDGSLLVAASSQSVCAHTSSLNFSGLRALDKDDVVQTRNSLIGMQELLLTHSPSSFIASQSDDSDTVTPLSTSVRGSDAPLVASLEQLLNSHADNLHDVMVAADPTLYKALFSSTKDQ